MSSLNNVAPNSEVGKAILILAAYYDALARTPRNGWRDSKSCEARRMT